MRFAWRWLKRLGAALLLVVVLLLLPVGYVELACRGDAATTPYAAILPPEHHRPEGRSYLTYPEWHIVHAYDDYAKVISDGDPHEFGYTRSIGGFWSSLCDLSRVSAAHGGFSGEIKKTIYVIGVSFSAEMLAKAAYEETIGRIATWSRGPRRAPLDDLSATQARDYARFLQQVPWYKWDFRSDANALDAAATDAFRDRERRFALGLEFRAKAAYASVIAQAVENVGSDALSLRMIVKDGAGTDLEGITRIRERPEGIELETPRYRALTRLMIEMAARGADFIEIAGNDDIMLTVISDRPDFESAQSSMQRQGYGDYRHIVGLKVRDLGDKLRAYRREGVRVEHIHDY